MNLRLLVNHLRQELEELLNLLELLRHDLNQLLQQLRLLLVVLIQLPELLRKRLQYLLQGQRIRLALLSEWMGAHGLTERHLLL